MSEFKDALGENKKFLLLALALLAVCALVVFSLQSGKYPSRTLIIDKGKTYSSAERVLDEKYDYSIIVSTVYGDIFIDLYEKEASDNVNSLLFLISKRYYEGLTFHKVVKDFVIQAGDTKGDGSGNPGYTVKRENLVDFNDYDVGMANASQFFIVLPNSNKQKFNGEYTLVGKVTKGFAVVDSIAKVEVNEDYKPVNDVVIKSILIQED
ncbi:MAG TPA: peptidylprolyl isomerase [Candidatus Dojkabacteria bacterium]|jgi:peptidyl-prolyl cis-trans isomerase A (cyclophilin A)|nr:peptidylprolyl isomerase [Candidatus Dojkabacteria bacterium]